MVRQNCGFQFEHIFPRVWGLVEHYSDIALREKFVLTLMCFIQELAFVEQLEPRMGAAAQRLQELLSEALAQALREGNAPARAHCLQAFSAVGDAVSAEQVPCRLCTLFSMTVLNERLCQERLGQSWTVSDMVDYCQDRLSWKVV